MADYRGIAVFCEVKGDKLLPIATEGLGAGRKLADALGQDLCAIVVGSNVAGIAPQAIMYGASKVYVVDDPLLKDYQAERLCHCHGEGRQTGDAIDNNYRADGYRSRPGPETGFQAGHGGDDGLYRP